MDIPPFNRSTAPVSEIRKRGRDEGENLDDNLIGKSHDEGRRFVSYGWLSNRHIKRGIRGLSIEIFGKHLVRVSSTRSQSFAERKRYTNLLKLNPTTLIG